MQVLSRDGTGPASIMVAPYPEADVHALDDAIEEEMELVTGIVRAIRNVRAEFKVEPRRPLEALIAANQSLDAVAGEAEVIKPWPVLTPCVSWMMTPRYPPPTRR